MLIPYSERRIHNIKGRVHILSPYGGIKLKSSNKHPNRLKPVVFIIALTLFLAVISIPALAETTPPNNTTAKNSPQS